MGTIKNGDRAFARHMRMHTPEKIVRQLSRCWLFEIDRDATRWVHSRQDMADDTVFACRVEPLQNN
jgi:hypothetical protein